MTSDKKPSLYWMLPAVVLLIVLAFEPVRHNDFIDYDDYDYIVKNHHIQGGLNAQSIVWAFTSFYMYNWHPLTWLSYLLDFELFGLNPVGYHLHNVLLHCAATALLFVILNRLLKSPWKSFFISAAFGIHPLRVESVAWVSERKDVLSLFFFMLTLLSYIYYIQNKTWKKYTLVLFCFALGLMAKPMLVTMPVLLLVLDWWPLRRLSAEPSSLPVSKKNPFFFPLSLLLEKLPLFLMSGGSSIVTYLAQKEGGSVWAIPLSSRFLNALNSYRMYISKIFCPIDLAVPYPYPTDFPISSIGLSAFTLLFITVWSFRKTAKYPFLLAGWLWYLITLIPVIGIIQVGIQAMADRYTYLPSIGIFLMIVFGADELTKTWKHRKAVLGLLGSIVVLGMLAATRNQISYWKDSVVFYKHTLAVTENNYIAESNLSQVLMEQNRFSEAEVHLTRALQLRSDSPLDNSNMALLLLLQNQPEKAMTFVHRALSTKHNIAKVYYNCGLIFEHFEQFDMAMNLYKQAVESKSDYHPAFNRMGCIREKQQRYEEAYNFYSKSIQNNPRYAEGYKNLAWLLAVHPAFEDRDPAEAVRYAQKACELTQYSKAEMLDVLAAAYANARDFDKAVQTAQKAVELARAAGRENLADDIIRRKNLYENKLPFRKTLPTETVEPLAEPSSL
ncbi:MAG: tetratricopeptide repeat protein [Anaerohalosphaeraceae bacterium]